MQCHGPWSLVCKEQTSEGTERLIEKGRHWKWNVLMHKTKNRLICREEDGKTPFLQETNKTDLQIGEQSVMNNSSRSNQYRQHQKLTLLSWPWNYGHSEVVMARSLVDSSATGLNLQSNVQELHKTIFFQDTWNHIYTQPTKAETAIDDIKADKQRSKSDVWARSCWILRTKQTLKLY